MTRGLAAGQRPAERASLRGPTGYGPNHKGLYKREPFLHLVAKVGRGNVTAHRFQRINDTRISSAQICPCARSAVVCVCAWNEDHSSDFCDDGGDPWR